MKPIITATVYDKAGRVLAVAQNSYIKTHPLMAWASKKAGTPQRIFLHAEVAALIKCDWTKVHSMFVSRYSQDGTPMNAKPCECCEHVINKVGVRNVSYTH